MDTPKRCGVICKSGKPCKRVGICYSHRKSATKVSPPKKISPKKGSPKKMSPKAQFAYFEQLPYPALERVLLNMEWSEIMKMCLETKSQKVQNICRERNFQEKYMKMHPSRGTDLLVGKLKLKKEIRGGSLIYEFTDEDGHVLIIETSVAPVYYDEKDDEIFWDATNDIDWFGQQILEHIIYYPSKKSNFVLYHYKDNLIFKNKKNLVSFELVYPSMKDIKFYIDKGKQSWFEVVNKKRISPSQKAAKEFFEMVKMATQKAGFNWSKIEFKKTFNPFMVDEEEDSYSFE